jgi:hypothetical protein
MTEEQKAKASANLKAAREKKIAAANERKLAAQTFPAPIIAKSVATEEPAPVAEDFSGTPLFDPLDQDEAVAEPEPLDDFGRFLLALDAETKELLTEDELRDIYEQQMAKAKAEKRAAAKKAAADRALSHARVESGLMPAEAIEAAKVRDRMNEMVRFTVDLPELGDTGLRIDQMIYLHGHTYTLPRAKYESYREIIWRNQQQELEFEGKGRGHWLRRQARSLDVSMNGAAA